MAVQAGPGGGVYRAPCDNTKLCRCGLSRHSLPTGNAASEKSQTLIEAPAEGRAGRRGFPVPVPPVRTQRPGQQNLQVNPVRIVKWALRLVRMEKDWLRYVGPVTAGLGATVVLPPSA
jgi:hypothetical protein